MDKETNNFETKDPQLSKSNDKNFYRNTSDLEGSGQNYNQNTSEKLIDSLPDNVQRSSQNLKEKKSEAFFKPLLNKKTPNTFSNVTSISEEQIQRISNISQGPERLEKTYSIATDKARLGQNSSGINQQSNSKDRRIITENEPIAELSTHTKRFLENQRSTWPFDFTQKNNGGSIDSQKGLRSEPMRQDIVSITYEEIGFFPRSFSRVFDRFLKQVFSDVDNLVIQEYRFYRYLFLTTLKCLLILFFVPFIVNYLSKTYLVSPLTEYFWNTQQTEIFLNSYQQKRAFTELKDFEEKLYFESLLHSGSKTNRLEEVSALTKSKLEKSKNSNSTLQQEISDGTKSNINLNPLNNEKTTTVFETNAPSMPESYDSSNVSLLEPLKLDMQTQTLKTPVKFKGIVDVQRTETNLKTSNSNPDGKNLFQFSQAEGSCVGQNPHEQESCLTKNLSTVGRKKRFFLNLQNEPSSIEDVNVKTKTGENNLGMSSCQQQNCGQTLTGETLISTRRGTILPQTIVTSIPEEHRHIVAGGKAPAGGETAQLKSNRQEIFEQRLQEKTIELAIRYNNQSIEAITNFFADLISFITLCYLLVVLEIQINITKSFLLEVFFGLDDGKKSLLILLITDLLVGYHSSNLWELFFEFLFNHYGLPESQTGIFLLVATLPVLLDVLFKYLIFRHLNRSSPATVATYHAIIE
jgi:hypothetical protein